MDLHRDVENFHLDSPFVTLEWDEIVLWQAILIGVLWLALWINIAVLLIWLYAVWFAGQVGFQTAVLVGIALIVLGLGGDS